MAREFLYPLFPVCSAVTASLILLVLATGTSRSWNFGLTVLFFWIFINSFVQAINAVIWADDAAVPTGVLAVYCDIWTHLQVFNLISMPACILVVTRRLHLIASQFSVDPFPTARSRRLNLFFEFILIFLLPAAASSIFYTFTQTSRFTVIEHIGCVATVATEGFTILTLDSWHILFPIISVCIYCPRIIFRFYRHSRELERFLSSNGQIFRRTYTRLMLLALLDFICVLPIGILNVIATVQASAASHTGLHFFLRPLPAAVVHKIVVQLGDSAMGPGRIEGVIAHVAQWGTVFEAAVVFALFGFTSSARAKYARALRFLTCRRRRSSSVDSGSSQSPRDSLVPVSGDEYDGWGPSISTIPLPLVEESQRPMSSAAWSETSRWSQASLDRALQLPNTPLPGGRPHVDV